MPARATMQMLELRAAIIAELLGPNVVVKIHSSGSKRRPWYLYAHTTTHRTTGTLTGYGTLDETYDRADAIISALQMRQLLTGAPK